MKVPGVGDRRALLPLGAARRVQHLADLGDAHEAVEEVEHLYGGGSGNGVGWTGVGCIRGLWIFMYMDAPHLNFPTIQPHIAHRDVSISISKLTHKNKDNRTWSTVQTSRWASTCSSSASLEADCSCRG